MSQINTRASLPCQPEARRDAPIRVARIALRLVILTLFLIGSRRSASADTTLTLWPSVTAGAGYGTNVKVSSNKSLGDGFATEQIGLYLEGQQARRTFSFLYEGLDQEYLSYSNLDRLFEDHYVGFKDTELLSKQSRLQINDSFLTGNAQSAVIGAGDLPLSSELIYSELFPARSAQNRFDLQLAGQFDARTAYSLGLHQYLFSGGGSVTADQGFAAVFYRQIEGFLSGGLGYQYDYIAGLSGPLTTAPKSQYNWPQAALKLEGEGPVSFESRFGPILEQSTSGVVGEKRLPSDQGIAFGGFVTASYSKKSFDLVASGGQRPGQAAGLAVGSINRGGYLLFNYHAWRDVGAFAQAGYLDFLNSGTDAQYIEVAAGCSYRLQRRLTITTQYVFLKSSSGSQNGNTSDSPPSERQYVLLSVTYALPPLRWNF